MKRVYIILGLAVAAGLVVFFILRRRTAAAATVMDAGVTAGTPGPQAGLASLLSGTPLGGFVNSTVGQTATNLAVSYLPPVAQGYLAGMPQQGAQPPQVAVIDRTLPVCVDVPPGTPCRDNNRFDSLFKLADKLGISGVRA